MWYLFHFSSAQGFRGQSQQSSAPRRHYRYNNVVFVGWDYSLTDAKAATLKQKNICNEMRVKGAGARMIVLLDSVDRQYVAASL